MKDDKLMQASAVLLLFAGLLGKDLPAGVPLATIIEQLRANGQGTFADLLSGMTRARGEVIGQLALGRVLSAGELSDLIARHAAH